MRRKSVVSDLRIGPFAPMPDYVLMFFEMVGACRNARQRNGADSENFPDKRDSAFIYKTDARQDYVL